VLIVHRLMACRTKSSGTNKTINWHWGAFS